MSALARPCACAPCSESIPEPLVCNLDSFEEIDCRWPIGTLSMCCISVHGHRSAQKNLQGQLAIEEKIERKTKRGRLLSMQLLCRRLFSLVAWSSCPAASKQVTHYIRRARCSRYEYMLCKSKRLSEHLRGMMFKSLAIEPQIFPLVSSRCSSIAFCGNGACGMHAAVFFRYVLFGLLLFSLRSGAPFCYGENAPRLLHPLASRTTPYVFRTKQSGAGRGRGRDVRGFE